MTEDKIIRCIRHGETDRLEALIEIYYDDVYRFICFKTGNAEAAWDLTQETFLKVIKYFDSYKGHRRFKGYVFAIAVNVCNDFYRENRNQTDRQVHLEDEKIDLLSIASDEAEAIDNQMALQQMLNLLPDYQREAIIYKYILGYKMREIADITGEKTATVKSRIRQGLEKLRREVK